MTTLMYVTFAQDIREGVFLRMETGRRAMCAA